MEENAKSKIEGNLALLNTALNLVSAMLVGASLYYSVYDYEAFTLCMRKINHQFKGKHIGLPLIGCGLAGAVWDITQLTEEEVMNHSSDLLNNFKDVKSIILDELTDMKVTIVHYER